MAEFDLAGAGRDGLVELVARIEGVGPLLQGWARHLPAGPIEIMVEGRAPLAAVVATHPRADTADGAHGFLMVTADDTIDPAGLGAVGFRAGGRAWRLDPYGKRRVLTGAEAARLVKGLLPKLRADADTLKTLRRAASGSFSGLDTVSALDAPVRLGLDVAAMLPDGGLLLAGWLSDPLDLIDEVTVRGPGSALALSPLWRLQPRPDLDEDASGFVVVTPPGSVSHLEVRLEDGSAAFVPVVAGEAPAARLLAWLEGLDPATAAQWAERVAPLRPEKRRIKSRSFGPAAVPELSVIMAAADGADLDIPLAGFALDPLRPPLEILVAAAPAAAPALAATLRRLVALYPLAVRLVVAEGGPWAALNRAAAEAAADTLLFLSPDVLPGPPGWLGDLGAALEPGSALSPALIREDGAIAFAGWERGDGEVGPAARSRFAGYPAAWIGEAGGAGVTPACCLLSRRDFERAGGFATDVMPAADFEMRLRAAGVATRWLSSPTLVLAETPNPTAAPGALDRVRFERRWAAQLETL